MAFTQNHECETCGHSIPLHLTYCGGEECLSRYAEDNELEGHPYADYTAWQQVATKAQADVDYHEWAVAHRDLDHLQDDKVGGFGQPHDAEQIAELREALHLGPDPALNPALNPAPKAVSNADLRASVYPAYSHAQFLSWQQAGGLPMGLSYQEWAEAHCELDELQVEEYLDRHDQDNIDALRAQLFFETAFS